MNKILFVILLLTFHYNLQAQSTFKGGWNTYQTATLIHQYTYAYAANDTSKLTMTDSAMIFISPDSLVTLTVTFPMRDRSIYKKVQYFNESKLIARTEEYKDDNLMVMNEWKYDDKRRKTYHFEDNKVNGNTYRKTCDYTTDKKTGEVVASECSYFNGRIEFYTKEYFNKKNVKYKEVRLNDNNRDVVHVENFYYAENGKLKERSVYFPEWKVTKKFEEKSGNVAPECFRALPVGTAEKITIAGKVPFIKRLIARNQFLFTNPECPIYEFTFRNFLNCEVIVKSDGHAVNRTVVFKYKEKNPK